MKPFNLQEAIEGKPLVTRDGRKVLNFHYFRDSKAKHTIIALVENELENYLHYYSNGTFLKLEESHYDLFMYEEPKKYFVNVYKNSWGNVTTGCVTHESRALAIKHRGENYINTIEITIP